MSQAVSIHSNLFHENSKPESTSLCEQASSLERIEETRDAAMQLWRASLLSMIEAMPPVPKQITEPHRKSLKQLVDETPNEVAPAMLEQRQQKTAEILKSYGAQMDSYMDSQDKEAKAVLQSVSQLTETLSGFDQRYAVKFQGITKKLRMLATCTDLTEIRTKLDAEVQQLERVIEEQQRDTRSAINRLNEDVSRSETRKSRALPSTATQHGSDSLLALERPLKGWSHYCLVRYEFFSRPGVPLDARLWPTREAALTEALPERMGQPVRAVSPKHGVLLAAVECQLLEYAGKAELMEKTLSQLSGAICSSRVVEPIRNESMRDALMRLEKAG